MNGSRNGGGYMSELSVDRWVSLADAQECRQAPIGKGLGGVFNPPISLEPVLYEEPPIFREARRENRFVYYVTGFGILLSGLAAYFGHVVFAAGAVPFAWSAVRTVRRAPRLARMALDLEMQRRKELEDQEVLVRETHARMRWKDLIDSAPEESRPYLEALRKEVLELRLRQGGIWHQNSGEGFPVFSDGSVGAFTRTAWGDFMAAVWAEYENKGYSTVHFQNLGCPFIEARSPWTWATEPKGGRVQKGE